MEKHSITIDGMGGEHCVRVINKRLDSIEGLDKVVVNIGKAAFELDETKSTLSDVVAAIEILGYRVKQPH